MATQDRPDDHQRARRADREASVVGSLSDMGVADLVQTLEMGKKSGVLHLHRTGARGTCWLRDGRVVDCELTGAPAGEEAFYRILRWREGGFAIEFGPVQRDERIELPTQALLLQGMRRLDEWGRAVELLPPLERRLEVDVARLGERLARMPDDANGLLRLFDGRRTLAEVLEAAPRDEVATADAVARLVADGVLKEAAAGAEEPQVETPGAAAPPPLEPGGVDWFAGPVGPAAEPAAVVPFAIAPPAEPAASFPPTGGAWLQPPLASPRPAPRFSIPVPPPGSLPPPPSVAETLARYQVVPRPRPVPAAEPPRGQGSTGSGPAPAPETPSLQAMEADATLATSEAAERVEPVRAAVPVVAEQVEPAPAAAPVVAAADRPVLPVAEQPAVRTTEPTAAPAPPAEPPARVTRPRPTPEEPPPELIRRLSGKPTVRRLDPGAIPVHLEAERLAPTQAAPPRRSAVPYLALGGILLAVIVGGTALTRRTVVREPAPAALPRSLPTPAAAALAEPAAPGASTAPGKSTASGESVATGESTAQSASAAPGAAEPSASSEQPERAAKPPDPARAAPPAAAPPARPAAVPAAAVSAAPAADEPDPRKLLAAADRKYAAGRYADAIADYRRAIALRSTPAAHVSLARALYDAHRSVEALQELEGVIAESPRDAGAWLLRGDIQQGEGRSAEAREAYQRFLELQPNGEQAGIVRSILEREQ